jgi:hypothetical protein
MIKPTENPVILRTANERLKDIYTGLSDLRGVQINALTKQTEVGDIVNKEYERLKGKQNTIDQAIENQKRILYFNDNSRKRYSAYLKMIIIIAITLGIIYLIRVLHYNVGEKIPDIVYNILVVATVSIGIIVIWRLYLSIHMRDRYNFDELKLPAPREKSEYDSDKKISGELGSILGCVGSQCCTPSTLDTPGTKWDPDKGKCVFSSIIAPDGTPSSSTPPQTPENPEDTESFTNKSVALPNDAFEYSQYSHV